MYATDLALAAHTILQLITSKLQQSVVTFLTNKAITINQLNCLGYRTSILHTITKFSQQTLKESHGNRQGEFIF